MSERLDLAPSRSGRITMSKVPEITVWFWVIKILCTTVGESFADWINMSLGVGLITTAVLFTVVLGIVLTWQVLLSRYQPFPYWLTVVVLSVTGTLYTDILTDTFGVPLAWSTAAFAVALLVVFGIWFARERTLSIHSIVSVPRELFYWVAILVTFALGTAVGDWTLELTGWGPGTAVLLPAGLIASIALGWRLGANPVLAFWLAYVLTRPLGANLGDWLGFPPDQRGLGLGVGLTSVLFLALILAIVVYLTISRVDVIVRTAAPRRAGGGRERLMLGYFAVIAIAAGSLLTWAHHQPHSAPSPAESESGPAVIAPVTPGQVAARFPAADVATFRSLATRMTAAVQAGDQRGAAGAARQLEMSWDDAQPRLQALDDSTWSAVDGRIDAVLTAVRAPHPDPATESQALEQLLVALS